MKNRKNRNITLCNKKTLILLAFFCLSFCFLNDADASVAEKKYETLKEKKERLNIMIDTTKSKQDSLSNQVKMMNLQIESYANDLVITRAQIEQNEGELELLRLSVETVEEDIDEKKKELASMLRLFYQTEKNLSVSFLAQDVDVSSVLNQSQYIDQASAKIDKVVYETQKKKDLLENKKAKIEEKNDELKEHRETFEEKVESLEDEEESKQQLLKATQGQEAQYKKLLTRVESQMEELIGDLDALSDDVKSDLDKIKKSASKPDSGLASEKWYYAQDDDDWGHKRIGLSSTLMKDYGCAVTAVSMVFTYHKEKIKPGELAGESIFARDLIVWPKSWGKIELESTTGHGNVDWDTIDDAIDDDKPVIVFIRSGTGGGHYVVIHGKDGSKYVVHDPLFGANIYLDTSRRLVGRIYNSSTTINQMIIYDR